MKIDRPTGRGGNRGGGHAAFTLVEVAFTAAIAALVLAGMFKGYNVASRRAQFAACSLAANTMAMQKLERVISADWIPTYGVNQLADSTLLTAQATNLCLPVALSNVVNCTIYTTINTNVSVNPPYAMIQVQCVWTFPTYGGTFTNTVAVLRAPNL
jgi:hypothetical protein